MRTAGICLVVLCLSLCASAASVVLVGKPTVDARTRQQFEAAAAFYGIDVEYKALRQESDTADLLKTFRNPKTVAVVLSPDVLTLLRPEVVFASLNRGAQTVPVLIAGVDEYTPAPLLQRWSSGTILESRNMPAGNRQQSYRIAPDPQITQQLGGVRLAFPGFHPASLALTAESAAKPLILVRRDGVDLPVLVRTVSSGRDVFFATKSEAGDIPPSPSPYREQPVFASLATPLLFLRYAAGEHAWHAPVPMANFTIDDLWLREPYGHVNYEDLLRQAQLHNFHATIAFIPWNFDRSDPAVVSLFREHPDRLSVCVHGNDHVHQEFGPIPSHPLEKQAEDLKQALARMDKFHELTGIPYDRVMVFPHSVAPVATFSLMKRYNYAATANSLNVPLDAEATADTGLALRTATLQFGDFSSLRRYSAETDIPEPQLAIDAFLGNPMLFYAHEAYFAPGAQVFNKTADEVNSLQPLTEWRSLGYIARHLYTEKLRDDGGYDVRAYSSTIEISNRHQQDENYSIVKVEDFKDPIAVYVDGQAYQFQRSEKQLGLTVRIPRGATRAIEVRYGNDLDLARVSIAKNSFTVKMIRQLSDFRDNVVSSSVLGRRFIHSYTDNGRQWNLFFVVCFCLLLVVAAFTLLRGRKGILTSSDRKHI